MKIARGGQVEKLEGVLKDITINVSEGDRRCFELWINRDSLSYLTVDELLDLKEEINKALQTLVL